MSDVKVLKTKKDILPDDIKANIYDWISIIVDFHGITKKDIEEIQEELEMELPAEQFSKADDSFSLSEMNSYGERNELSKASCKRYLENENTVRYYAKDNTEKITISRLYISIELSYEKTHKLKDNIELMRKLVDVFNKKSYFEIQGIYLEKRDSVYCSSLYRLYQCFERKLFADMGYYFKQAGREIDTGMIDIHNKFAIDNYEISIYKKVLKGELADSSETYEGKLITIVSSKTLEGDVDVKEVLLRQNEISFEIFKYHITESFAKDLMRGKTNKVKEGWNCNVEVTDSEG